MRYTGRGQPALSGNQKWRALGCFLYRAILFNLGIGTASPSTILAVVQTSATDPIADAWTVYSSRRWKDNIQPLDGALEKVLRLRGVTFDWKADGKHDIGMIAEEVGEVLPELVAYEENGVDAKSLDYAHLTVVLVEAVKAQQQQIQDLQQEVSRLKGNLSVLPELRRPN